MHQLPKFYSGMKIYMFRAAPLPIIRSLFTVYKPVWHIPVPSVQWINSWWQTDELSETCRISCQNKSVKLAHLVGLIIKKFFTMYGHMNVKYIYIYICIYILRSYGHIYIYMPVVYMVPSIQQFRKWKITQFYIFRSSFFWGVEQCRMVVTDVSAQLIGTNSGNSLPIYAA
jgi:hypothetical protein